MSYASMSTGQERMAGAQHTPEYRALIRALVELRAQHRLSQTDLAVRLGRNRSYIAKVELCERRLDVIELCVWLSALNVEASEFIRVHCSNLPARMPEASGPQT